MKGIVTTPECVIYGYIICESLGDIEKIKSLENSISALDSDDNEEVEEWMKDPRYAKIKEAKRKNNEERLHLLKTRGSHPDDLQPILILLGDISMIQRDVLESAKEILRNDEHHKYDIEFREIDSLQLTKDFIASLPTPKGKDGGILVIKNISKFIEMYDVMDQNGIIRNIMVNPTGVTPTGWRIIFLEEAGSEDVAFENSFVGYWTKGNLHLLFVRDEQ